jgi:TldD protein
VLDGLSPAGKGWEQMLDADIPGQLRAIPERVDAQVASMANPKAAQVGRYTLVCDGATMAALTERTLGMATQIDRALGYEANASGTSFLNEPLAMLGSLQLTSPLVTVTANRSAPGQLATVKWDTEGVEPDDFTLIHDGVLVDYQTTREQAAWLAPYYQKARRPVRSHGCAAVQNALSVPMQHMPNLALAAARTDVTTDDLVANIKEGVLVTHGETKADFQARTGTLTGIMHEIKNGRVGRPLQGGAVIYDTIDFWKHVIAVGGTSTQAVIASTTYPGTPLYDRWSGRYPAKGEPPQRTSTSIQGVAATVTNQAIVDLRRKA